MCKSYTCDFFISVTAGRGLTTFTAWKSLVTYTRNTWGPSNLKNTVSHKYFVVCGDACFLVALIKTNESDNLNFASKYTSDIASKFNWLTLSAFADGYELVNQLTLIQSRNRNFILLAVVLAFKGEYV